MKSIFVFRLLLIGLFFCLAVGSAKAADVTLAWDPNDPAPEGYRIFSRATDGNYDYASPAWQGSETTGIVSGLTEGETRAYVVRAYEGALESADSNEVVYTTPLPAVTIIYPPQPRNIVIR